MSPTRALRRIQIIVAIMMILSMFVGSPAAQARVYGPDLPTYSSPPQAMTEDDLGVTLTSSQAVTVTFGISVPTGQTVLGTEIQVRARRLGPDGWVSTAIQQGTGSGSSSYLTSADTWTSNSWAVHSYYSNEDDALRQYVQDAVGDTDITFRVRRTDGTRSIEIDWAKLAVTTAEPTVAPPVIVGECSPANIHLVVDNSASIGSSLSTMKTNIKSFMATVETAIPGTNWNVTKFWGNSSASSSGWAADPATLTAFIDGMTSQSNSYTPTASGIAQARSQGIPSGTSSLPKIMLIITDGAPNRPLDPSVSTGFYYYRGAAEAIEQADGARNDGWSTIVGAIQSVDSYAPPAPYPANVNRGLAGIDVDGPAGDVMSTDFSGLGGDLVSLLASGCAIDLVKTVDQEVVVPGTQVTYTYVVSNPMSVSLSNIRLSDDKCSPISAPTVISGNTDSILDPSEIWQYTCAQQISVDTVNTAVVTGTIASVGADVTDTDTATVLIGNLRIAGAKYEDLNGDGDQDAGEPTLQGWTIQLEDEAGGVITTTTNLFGAYFFNGLVPGTYTVTEVLQDGWVQTAPAGGVYRVVLPDDETGDGIASDKDFGNLQLGALDVEKVVDWNGVAEDSSQTFDVCIQGPSYTSGACETVPDGDNWVASWRDLIPGVYTVTETDPGAEWTVSGSGEVSVTGGSTVTATVTNTRVQRPGLSLLKEVSASASGPWQKSITVLAGTDVHYRFAVTNTGNVALSDVTVGDNTFVTGCSWTTLSVGASDTCVAGPVTALAGQVVNTAMATGLLGAEQQITSNQDSATYTGLVPAIDVAKIPDVSAAYPGDTVGYFYVVSNIGQVTLTNVTLTDDKLGAITLPVTVLSPGWAATGYSTYLIQTDDVSPIVNEATAIGTATVGDHSRNVSDTATATVEVLPLGALDIHKLVDWNGVAEQPVAFTICIEGPSYPSGYVGTANCQTLPQGVSWTASWTGLRPGVYTITEQDAGSEWTPIGSGAGVTVVGGQTANHTIANTRVQRPALDLTKVADPTATDPGGVVRYTLHYTNSGNIALTNVTLVDDPDENYVDSVDSISGGGAYDGDEITWSIGTLAAGASGSVSYQATLKGEDSFTVGQTAVDNTATINSAETGPVSDEATVTVTVLSNPTLSLVKEISATGSGPWQESITVLSGTDVYYRFTITNTGNIALSNLSLEDDTFTPACTWPASLTPGASAGCISGPVTALAGTHTNTAQAFAYSKEISSNTDTASYTGLSPAVMLAKTADVASAYPGDTVTYSYVVTNTGNVTLTNVVLDDDKLGAIALGDAELDPGESTTGSASYTVQVGDSPEIVNTAYVTGTATVDQATMDVSDSDDATVEVILPGTLTIIKDAAGDTMAEFGFTLGLGQAQLNILPRDGSLPLQFTLKGGESRTFDLEPGFYTIDETSMPTGWVLSDIACDVQGGQPTALAIDDGAPTGTGGYIGEGMAVTCTFHNRYPALTLAKEVGTSNTGPWQEHATVQVGSDVHYRLTVTNTGNVALTNAAIVDPDVDATGCAWPTSLAPGASAECVVGPIAAIAGEHINTAYATALFEIVARETSVDVTSNEDSARYTGVVPGLELDKAVAPTGADPGDTVAYTIRYTNTGTMDLTGVILTDDPDETYVAAISAISGGGAYDGDAITWAIGNLAAGAGGSVTYQATMKDEAAFAIGQTPVDNVAVITSDQAGPAQDEATVIVTRLLQPEPGLSLDKVGSVTVAHIGDTVAYTLTVQNTGNITLTNVTVVDAKLGIDENVGNLAPCASALVTGSYAVTEADVDGIVNTAIADSDQTEPVQDSWTVQVIAGPALRIEKVGSTTAAQLGDTVVYTLTVTNIGDVTLTNVTVVDAKLGINQSVGSLAPGASAQVSGSYLVTVADLGAIVNTAIADSDQTEPVQDTWTVEVGMRPGLVIAKTVNTATAKVGDLITFTLTVTNTGDVPLTDVTISDPMLGIYHNIGGLAVGESARMEVPYTVTESDIGGIHNVATVTGKDPADEVLTDDDDASVIVEREYVQPPTPVPCIRADVAVVIFGGWNGIPVKAWVGGTEQQTLHTAVDAFGQPQVMWTFYPPANTSWNVAVQPQTPDGMDAARWQYKLVRIASPSQGTENNSPGSPSVSITRCNQYVLYFQLMDNGVTPPVAPTPPSEPQLPVTGGGPEPIVAGGLGLFAALSGLGWSIRRRREQ